MVAIIFLVWLVPSLIQCPLVVGDGLEKETRLHMEVHAKCQERERIRLLQELEQATQEQSGTPEESSLLLFGPVSSGQEKYPSSKVDETANDKGNNAVAKTV